MRTDLPSDKASNFNARIRETLMTYLGRQGDPLDRGLTLRDLVESGIVKLDGALRPGSTVPLAPGPNVVPDTEPDLTPPPTPTGLAATAGLSFIIVEHDNPVFPQGKGYLRTHLYGATWTTTLPTFADAVEIAQFTGTVYAHPTSLNTKWRLWAKWESVDGVLSASPAGGTNGVAAQTGLVGGQDLTPLIITADKIASGAIDLGGAKVTGLLANTNMAVITDPTKIADSLIGNTKLANLAVDAAKLADSAVTATKIANLAVGTAAIQTGAITNALIANAAVGSAQIVDAAITSAKIANLAAATEAVTVEMLWVAGGLLAVVVALLEMVPPRELLLPQTPALVAGAG